MSKRRTSETKDRRDAILDAALHCFVERGFHGTAVPQVARQAGVATGTMYHYFPSKEVLVNVLYQKWKEAIAARVFLKFPASAPVHEQFMVMWREMADFALGNPAAFAFLELHNHRSYLDAASRAMENRLKDFAAFSIQRAQGQGIVRAGSTVLLMELVFGAFNGMMRAYTDGRVELTPDQVELAAQACWDALAAPTAR